MYVARFVDMVKKILLRLRVTQIIKYLSNVIAYKLIVLKNIFMFIVMLIITKKKQINSCQNNNMIVPLP